MVIKGSTKPEALAKNKTGPVIFILLPQAFPWITLILTIPSQKHQPLDKPNSVSARSSVWKRLEGAVSV